MAVISDCLTASQMRDEVLHELRRRRQLALRDTTRTGKGITQKDIAFRRGYAAALSVQHDFWLHLWVEGKQGEGASGL